MLMIKMKCLYGIKVGHFSFMKQQETGAKIIPGHLAVSPPLQPVVSVNAREALQLGLCFLVNRNVQEACKKCDLGTIHQKNLGSLAGKMWI